MVSCQLDVPYSGQELVCGWSQVGIQTKALWGATQNLIPVKTEGKRLGLCASWSQSKVQRKKVCIRSFWLTGDRNPAQTKFHSKWKLTPCFS